MRGWMLAAGAALALGMAGGALAQGDVVAERRGGLRQMGQHMEAIGAVLQGRGDQRQIAQRIDQMIPFYQRLPNLVPAASLTPPVAQGTGDGQTRALVAIEQNRGGFAQANTNMVNALTAMKTAAEAGGVTPDMLRQTGATCGACHQNFRAR
jgi:cytochrome c556